MFFADAVIFVEGADKYILELISEEVSKEWKITTIDGEEPLGKNWLNDFNISIINCGGKTEFWKYIKVFKEIGIPWLIIADFDYLRDGLKEFFSKLSYEKKLNEELSALKSHVHIPTNCKSINSISIRYHQDIISYINKLKDENLFILTGELENFYLKPLKNKKEQAVLEIIENCKTENKSIKEFVKTDEFEDPLKKLVKDFLKLNIVNSTPISSYTHKPN